MSMLMSQCESCNYLIVNDSVCANCGHSKNPDSNAEYVIEEFGRRRALHNRNSTILMCVKLIGGGFALLGSTAAVWGRLAKSAARSRYRLENRVTDVESSFINYEALTMIGLVVAAIFILVTIYHLFIEKSDSILPVALCCPKCDERLDELNIDYSQCPSCSVHLQ